MDDGPRALLGTCHQLVLASPLDFVRPLPGTAPGLVAPLRPSPRASSRPSLWSFLSFVVLVSTCSSGASPPSSSNVAGNNSTYDEARTHLQECLALAGDCQTIYACGSGTTRQPANQVFFHPHPPRHRRHDPYPAHPIVRAAARPRHPATRPHVGRPARERAQASQSNPHASCRGFEKDVE